eukprot:TRINITY_DN8473_c0_g1_i1.p1 TRINITY_DN8473_c0_g1~~TRINITY_DN8473_c0_g1_i1.p1  ORF type:complete len:575 (+),score=96.75 TRINITY_DN8473_c0_g1_i1:13-1737(+)
MEDEPIENIISKFVEDLNDSERRLEGSKNLLKVAQAVGEETAREQLMPYLQEYLDDDEPIVLLVFAKLLPLMIEYIGGYEYSHAILPSLEILAMNENNSVREKSVQSIWIIIGEVSPEDIDVYFVPMLQRLGDSPWIYPKKSVCELIGHVYGKCNEENKVIVLDIFRKLCVDKFPMIRKLCNIACKDIIQHMEKDSIPNEIFPQVLALFQDEQDSVRLWTIENIVAIGTTFNDDIDDEIMNIIIDHSSDESWRVRYNLAQYIDKICEYYGHTESNIDQLLRIYQNVLYDVESVVRKTAAKKLVAMYDYYTHNLYIEKILPIIIILHVDPDPNVRKEISTCVTHIAPFFGADLYNEFLLEVLFHLIEDNNSECRLNTIEHIELVADVIGLDIILERLINTITELSSCPLWRVRLKTLDLIPSLAELLGKKDFSKYLLDNIFQLYEDKVHAVRHETISCLRILSKSYGTRWTKSYLIPQICKQADNNSYLIRMNALFTVSELCSSFTNNELLTVIVPLLMKLSCDPVPNVRLNVCKSLYTIENRLPNKIKEEEIYPCLKQLKEDKDEDVRYYANKR